MDIETAKIILSAYQVERGPFGNPQFAKALEMVERDPALAEWFEGMIGFDESIRRVIRSAPEPVALKEKLLEGYQEARSHRRTWVWSSLGGLAAALIIGVGGFFAYTIHYNRGIDDISSYRDAMAHFAVGSYFRLDYHDENITRIQNWLTHHDAVSFEDLSDELLALTPKGCKMLEWQGHQVSLVCFRLEDGNLVHLFITDEDARSVDAFKNIEMVFLAEGLETGGWRKDGKVFLLTGSAPGVSIDEFLG